MKKTAKPAPKNQREIARNANGHHHVVAVDLFCGAGGLTKGLNDAGIKVLLGIDVDPACEYPYTANNRAKFALKSVKYVMPEDISRLFGKSKFTLLAGCAPCQPFSTYRRGKSDQTDRQWHLLGEFQRLVLEVKPVLVTMENVPRLAEQDIFYEFVSALERDGYHLHSEVVKCADYGVPQQRERFVLLASRLGPLKLLPPTHAKKHRTARQAIGRQPPLAAGRSTRLIHFIKRLDYRPRISGASRHRSLAAAGGIGTSL